jgi:fatty-acyl-CoA synthase
MTSFALGLEKNPANYIPLSPLSFLRRAAEVYPERLAVIHGEQRHTWRQIYSRCRRLASALKRRGIGAGDTVAIIAPNVPAMFEAHYGIPMTGAVINALNTRLDPASVAFMLKHGEAKVLLSDRELSGTVGKALQMLERPPLVIDIDDPLADGGELLGEMEYENFLATGAPERELGLPGDEWDAIALNYTSGTTGDPKGVVLHHRGAYINAVSNAVTWAMPHFPVYLWTLPMFHGRWTQRSFSR